MKRTHCSRTIATLRRVVSIVYRCGRPHVNYKNKFLCESKRFHTKQRSANEPSRRCGALYRSPPSPGRRSRSKPPPPPPTRARSSNLLRGESRRMISVVAKTVIRGRLVRTERSSYPPREPPSLRRSSNLGRQQLLSRRTTKTKKSCSHTHATRRR